MKRPQVVRLADAIRIAGERRNPSPPWKRYFEKNREKKLASQKEYRVRHREQILPTTSDITGRRGKGRGRLPEGWMRNVRVDYEPAAADV